MNAVYDVFDKRTDGHKIGHRDHSLIKFKSELYEYLVASIL